MPTSAVAAKNALISFLDALAERAVRGYPQSLPSYAEWESLNQHVINVLKRRRLKFSDSNNFTWKELARIERAYRSLSFDKWFGLLVSSVEQLADPYSQLQSAYWDELRRERLKPWDKRTLASRAIDWAINELRAYPDFTRGRIIVTFDQFESRFPVSYERLKEWVALGQILSRQMGVYFAYLIAPSVEVPETHLRLAAIEAFEVFTIFQRRYFEWRKRDLGRRTRGSIYWLLSLERRVFNSRLLRLFYPEYSDLNYRRFGQSTKVIESKTHLARKQKDAARKRLKTGGKVRSKRRKTPKALIKIWAHVKLHPQYQPIAKVSGTPFGYEEF